MRQLKAVRGLRKETLSSEDQALLLKQAQNEFNKKFRGTVPGCRA